MCKNQVTVSDGTVAPLVLFNAVICWQSQHVNGILREGGALSSEILI